MAVELGDKVRDAITGFNGIAVGRIVFLYGCSRIQIEPDSLDKDGKVVEAHWFDEQRVMLVETKAKPDATEGRVTTGGPRDNPTRSEPPARASY